MPGGDSGFQQVQRAGDIGVDKSLSWITDDIRLMQRAGMNNRLWMVFGKDAIDQRTVRDRPQNPRIRAVRDIEADDIMTEGTEARRQKSPKPARGTCQKNAHDAAA